MRKIEKLSSSLEFRGEEKLGLVNKRGERINEIEKVERKSEKIINEPEQKEEKIEYKWSKELKSDAIMIKGNVITKTEDTDYYEFFLLNASFSNTLKEKQSWAIQINKIKDWIFLGVCLKSTMNNNFNEKNINWGETGHGMYLIGSTGFCLSHSEKEFNFVNKSFEFGDGDIIYIEYDPIDLKLRFSKNKSEYFELEIITPPENDAYHPFVALWRENESVDLIHPVEFSKEVNDTRNKGFWSGLFGA